MRLALQASSVEDLPDHLLYNILAQSWRARPQGHLAAAEVRHAVQLRNLVSRRISRLLRGAQPLLLELDFSNTLLREEHLAWLAHPAWTNCVEALTLHGWRGQLCEGNGQIVSSACAAKALCDGVSLLLGVLLSNQRGALRRLHGVPLRLPQPLGHDGPARSTDLSAFAITELGLTVAEKRGELNAALLPATLVSLVCCQVYKGAAEFNDARHVVAWADAPGGPPGTRDFANCLPELASVCHTGYKFAQCWEHPRNFVGRGARDEHVSILADRSLLIGRGDEEWEGTSESSYFPWAASVHLQAPKNIHVLTGGVASIEDAALMLCPAYLDKAVLVLSDFSVKSFGYGHWSAREFMRYLVSERGSEYAFEVLDDGGWLAWQRWPPADTPAFDTALRLHQQAAEWAAKEAPRAGRWV